MIPKRLATSDATALFFICYKFCNSAAFPNMKGFSTRNLRYMRLFAKSFLDFTFVQQVAAQIPWFHIVTVMDKVKGEEAKLFYLHKALENNWSRSSLTREIGLELYDRQGKAITNFKEQLPSSHFDLANQILKDP